MPTENTTSSSEATLLVAVQHVLARRTGTCDRKTAPKNHIHEMPSSERNTTRLPCASFRLRQVSVNGFQLMTQRRVGGRRGRHGLRQHAARPRPGPDTARRPMTGPTCGHRDQQAAGHVAEQDGDEGAHLDHAVAAGELALAQVLRQVGELHRPEQRAVQAHQEDAAQQQRHVALARSPSASSMIATSRILTKRISRSCRTCRPAARRWPRTAGRAG